MSVIVDVVKAVPVPSVDACDVKVDMIANVSAVYVPLKVMFI
jgi:hypothetical protein